MVVQLIRGCLGQALSGFLTHLTQHFGIHHNCTPVIKVERSGEGEHQLDLFTWLGKQKLSSRPLSRLSCQAHWSQLCHETAPAAGEEGNGVFLHSASMVEQSEGERA